MTLPVGFLAHGSPMVAVEADDFTATLERWGKQMQGVEAIIVVSAHWQARRPPRVMSWERAKLLYDFGGFPEELYKLTYDAPGSPELAEQVVALIGDAELETSRGLDHGAWVPLRWAFPAASIPVLEVAMPSPSEPKHVFQLGRALRPLREHGVLILGSGGLVHNLRLIHSEKRANVDKWASEFDGWLKKKLLEGDFKAIREFRSVPHGAMAAPTTEHFDPLFAVLGAAYDDEPIRFLYEGFQYGNLSMRSLLIGAS